MHLCMYVISIIMAPCNDGSVLKEQSYCAGPTLQMSAEREKRAVSFLIISLCF